MIFIGKDKFPEPNKADLAIPMMLEGGNVGITTLASSQILFPANGAD